MTGRLCRLRLSLRKTAKQLGHRRSQRRRSRLALEPLESRVLLSTGEIHGFVFNDLNGNGQVDAGEPGVVGRVVFLDQDQNGILDPGEPWTTTAADGSYSFTNLAPGLYHVAEQMPNSWKQTFPTTAEQGVNLTSSPPQQDDFTFSEFQSTDDQTIGPYHNDGYTITTTAGLPNDLFRIRGSLDIFYYAGKPALTSDASPVIISLMRDDGTPFTLSQIDLAPYWASNRPTVTFTGHKADGTTVTQSFTITHELDFQTAVFNGFDNVISVTWPDTNLNDFHQFTDVVVSTSGSLLATNVNFGTTQIFGTISDTFVTPGTSGTVQANFKVQLSTTSPNPVTLNYSTMDANAMAGSDYVAASGSVIIPAGGTQAQISVTVNADPNVEPNETFALNLQSTDVTLTRAQATCTIIEDQLTASADSYTGNEFNPLVVPAPGVLANDTSAEGNAFSAALVSSPRGGQVTLNADGSFTYTPQAGFWGFDSFTYKDVLGTLSSSPARVQIQISPGDLPPVASDDTYTIAEGQELSLPSLVGETGLSMVSQPGDFIGQGQTYGYGPLSGSFSVSHNYDNGVSFFFQYFNNINIYWMGDFAAPLKTQLIPGYYPGATRFPFQQPQDPGLDISGEGRGSNTLTGNFTVKQVVFDSNLNVTHFDATFEQHSEGAPPALFGEFMYNYLPTQSGVLANDSDPDGDFLSAILVSGPSHGVLTLNSDGSFLYRPNPGFTGTDTFRYKANDGSLDSNIATVTINVIHLIVTGFPSPTTAGGPESFTVAAEDDNGNIVTTYNGTVHFTSSDPLAVMPADYTFTSADAGQHTFSGTLNTVGSQSLTVTDTANAFVTGSQTGITVNPPEAPSVSPSLLADINPGAGDSIPRDFVALNGFTFFVADDGVHGDSLWKSNGTPGGTVRVKDFNNGSIAYPYLTNVNGTLFFFVEGTSNDQQFWKTDGTTAGTVQIMDFNPGSSFPDPVAVNGTLFFVANDGASSNELWKTNGTAAGTVLVKDFHPGGVFSNPTYLTNVNGTLFFAADDGVHGQELWKSDGTEAGTVMVKDISPGTSGFGPAGLTNVNGILYFEDDDGTNGGELWRSDGTDSGTYMVKDIYPGPVGSYPFNLTNANGTLFFEANDGTHGYDLWKSDGTAAGTIKLTSNLNLGAPLYLTNVNNTLFFNASDGFHGEELWKTDGTVAGTVLVRDLNPGPGSSGPRYLTNVNGTLFFAAYDSTHGYELWQSDGTAAGTFLVMDINPGIASSTGRLASANNTLFFVANDGMHGSEPWVFQPIHFSLSGSASTTAGSAFNLTVTALDEFNNVLTGYTGAVHLTSTDSRAILPANYTFTAANAGVHTFSVTLKTAGNQSITANDTANASILGTQSGIMVSPAAPYKLAIARFPYKPTVGVPGSFRVTAQDRYGNTIPSFTDTVTFTSSDAQAVLPADYTFTGAGVQDFMATLYTAGSQSITVQDVTHPAIFSATQSNILMQPAAASQLRVTGFPSSVLAGTAHSFTVTALDLYGNVATSYRGTVTFSSSDTQAMLPGDYAFTSSDAGMHTTFSASLNTPGTQSIKATDTVLMGTEPGIAVVSTQPTASASAPSPALGVPGQPLAFTFSASESGTPTTFTYSVDWGDGSTQSLPSSDGSAFMVSHAFPSTGSFTVSVIATDSSGRASLPASAAPVSIATLAMEAEPYYSNQTALYVGGTTGNDNIAITPAVRTVNGNLDYGVKVGMNYVNYGSFFSISRVVVYSQAGNDIIKTAAQTINGTLTYVSVPVMFFAGNGKDILNLTGSGSNANVTSPNNVLVGGGGTDRLIGGQGRDILIGGAGQATLQAGGGGDILIGGTTAYDNNAAALAAILAEWSRTDIDYATRMADLTNTTGGKNVINGVYFFLNNGMNGPRTVFGNNLADTLYGGAGMDWFFKGMMDMLRNMTTDETVTPI